MFASNALKNTILAAAEHAFLLIHYAGLMTQQGHAPAVSLDIL
jgi:hypothetical protein